VVVGSALVQTIAGGMPEQLPGALETQVRALRNAMDAAARPSREATE
jgi:tryptophan synthase alpha subunit